MHFEGSAFSRYHYTSQHFQCTTHNERSSHDRASAVSVVHFLGLSLWHLDFCPDDQQELVPQLVESYMLLLSTRPGSMAAAMCAAHGAAKERKRMMRSLKGYVAASLMHRYYSRACFFLYPFCS